MKLFSDRQGLKTFSFLSPPQDGSRLYQRQNTDRQKGKRQMHRGKAKGNSQDNVYKKLQGYSCVTWPDSSSLDWGKGRMVSP